MRGVLGVYIEERRKEVNLKKNALADSAGLSRQGLYKILNGDVEQIQLSTIVSLAVPLKVHPIFLMQKLFQRWEFPAVETQGALLPKDATGFIGDITYPDNSIVTTGQRFTKVWRSQNVGKQTWEDCSLKCFDGTLRISTQEPDMGLLDERRGLIPQSRKISIPVIKPGETVDLEVCFTAPDYPCTAVSYWKMVDKDDKICFPQSEGLSCLVQVIKL